MRRTATMIAAGMIALAPLAALAGDRPPTDEERAQIEEVLRAEGFTAWDEIEWDDDGYWEVDDAIGPDGAEYDLRLDANFRIIERERD